MPVRRYHLLQLQKWEALGHGASFPAMHRSTAPAGCPRRTPAELERAPLRARPPIPRTLTPENCCWRCRPSCPRTGSKRPAAKKKKNKKSLETKGTQRKGSKRLLAYTAPPDDLLAAVKRCAARPPPTAPC